MEVLPPERAEVGSVSGRVFAKCSAQDIYLTGAVPSGATATVSYEEAGLRNCVSYSGAEFNVKIAHHTREQACPGKDCWLCPHYAPRLPHPHSVLVVGARFSFLPGKLPALELHPSLVQPLSSSSTNAQVL